MPDIGQIPQPSAPAGIRPPVRPAPIATRAPVPALGPVGTPVNPPTSGLGSLADAAGWNGQGSSLVNSGTGQPLTPQQLAYITAMSQQQGGQGPQGPGQSDIQGQINQILQQVVGAITPAQVNMGALTAPYDMASNAANAAGKAGIGAIGTEQAQASSQIDHLMQQYATMLSQAQGQQNQTNATAGSNLNSALAPLQAALQAQGAGGANNPLSTEASMLRAQQAVAAGRANTLLGQTGANENTALTNDKALTAQQAQSALGLLQSNLTNAMNQIAQGKAGAQLKGTQDQMAYNDASAKNVASILGQANKFLQQNGMVTGKQDVQNQLSAASQQGSGHEWAAQVFNTLLRGGTDAAGNKIPVANNQAQLIQNFNAALPALQAKGVDTSLLQNWIQGYYDSTPKSMSAQAPQMLAQFLSTLAPTLG